MTDISAPDDISREESRIRDQIQNVYAEAQQAFHAFDRDHDGRLSESEFSNGVLSLFTDNKHIESSKSHGQNDAQQQHKPAPVSEGLLQRLFRRADGDGDGFLAYHEFLARYGVKPVMRQALSVDGKIRDLLKKKFQTSSMEAFQALDVDQDGRLSLLDLREGLRCVCVCTCACVRVCVCACACVCSMEAFQALDVDEDGSLS